MSVLVKGMEMPESCEKCGLCDVVYCNSYRFCSLDFYRETRAPDCPLIEVPPHGRLIDADALKEQWLNAEKTTGAEKVLNLPLECFISYGCVYDLDNAPTIIEAEAHE